MNKIKNNVSKIAVINVGCFYVTQCALFVTLTIEIFETVRDTAKLKLDKVVRY